MAQELDLGSVIGPQGPKGETGLQGPKGETGATGPQGRKVKLVRKDQKEKMGNRSILKDRMKQQENYRKMRNQVTDILLTVICMSGMEVHGIMWERFKAHRVQKVKQVHRDKKEKQEPPGHRGRKVKLVRRVQRGRMGRRQHFGLMKGVI